MAINNLGYSYTLPTPEQLDKYCIAVVLDTDNQTHYFAIKTIVEFTDDSFTVRWGRYGEYRTTYKKENILNWESVAKEYKEKKQ